MCIELVAKVHQWYSLSHQFVNYIVKFIVFLAFSFWELELLFVIGNASNFCETHIFKFVLFLVLLNFLNILKKKCETNYFFISPIDIFLNKKLIFWPHIWARFLNPDRTVWSDQENLEQFRITVHLPSKTVSCKKSGDPYESRSDRSVLWTVSSSGNSNQSYFYFLFFKNYRHSTKSPLLKLQPKHSVKRWTRINVLDSFRQNFLFGNESF